MFDELYSQGDSGFHRADPRVKLLMALILMSLLAVCQRYITAVCGLSVAALLLLVAQLPLRQVIRRLLIVNGFIAFLWLIVPLTTPGAPIWSWQGLSISREGVQLVTLLTLKSNAILLLFFSLLATSHIAALGQAMARLGLPTKLCHLLLFCYRYLFVIAQQYQRLRRAARLRCFRPSNRLHSYQTFGYLLGMTLVSSWQRSDRVNAAMRMRGFNGQLYSLSNLTLRRSDLVIAAGLLGVAIGLVLVEWR